MQGNRIWFFLAMIAGVVISTALSASFWLHYCNSKHYPVTQLLGASLWTIMTMILLIGIGVALFEAMVLELMDNS
jgi:formate/nitrite transporter FocA (FNT family)